jgi:putative endonuclease
MAFIVMHHFVYILYSASADRYYVGQSEDPEARLHYHNNPLENRKFTAKGRPWIIKLSVALDSKAHAMALETFLKRMKSRQFIEKFIHDLQLREIIIMQTAPDCLISPEASG